MGRRKLNRFTETKMLASRVESSDFYAFEEKLTKERKTVQDALNAFLKSYVAGQVQFSGSALVGVIQPS